MSSSIARSGILIADDDADQRTLLATTLRADGHRVIEAHDGDHLLDLVVSGMTSASRSLPDLIVCDLNMPAKNGLQVTADLRELGVSTPVIMTTAEERTHIDLLASQLDIIAILRKPLRPPQLRRLVRRAITPRLRPPKVLLAERRRTRRFWLRTALVQRGLPTTDAATSWEALSMLSRDPSYDVVVVGETQAPDPHGLALMARQAGLDLPFLLITPGENDLLGARLKRLGHAILLPEPLDLEVFVDRARSLCGAVS